MSNQGVCLAWKVRFRDDLDRYARALRIDPTNAITHNHIGMARINLADDPGAIEGFHTAVRLDPDFVEARLNLAQAPAARGDAEAARTHYEQALLLDPSNQRARNGWGRLGPAASGQPLWSDEP